MSKLTYVVCVLALLCGVALAAAHKHVSGAKNKVDWTKPAVSRDIIRKVNADKTSTWKAGVNTKFKGLSLEDVKPFLGAKLGGPKLPKRVWTEDEEIDADLPTDWDARTQWGKTCQSLYEIRDQSKCGSCWAFGAAEAMTDRLCIASNGAKTQHLSATDLLACCDECGDGCDGGYPFAAWAYWQETGLVTGGNYSNATGIDNGCYPYPFPPCEHHVNGTHFPACPDDEYATPSCPNKCSNKATWAKDKVKGKSAYSVSGEEEIMKEMYASGPVEVDFTVYEDFLAYKSGVYQYTTGSALGGHAVKFIGWGVDNGVKYWTVINSWNSDWGDNGQFKIIRGTDDCGIEDDINAGLPAL